jgi:hypothetical protein
MTEFQTGLMMATNGLIIFLFEIPLVNFIENNEYNKIKIIMIGKLLFSISFFLLINNNSFEYVLWIALIILTIGEMLFFPFSNFVTFSRAPKGQHGKYM